MLCPIQAVFFSYSHWLHCMLTNCYNLSPKIYSTDSKHSGCNLYWKYNYLEYDVPFMKLACFMRWKIKLKLACLHWDEDNFQFFCRTHEIQLCIYCIFMSGENPWDHIGEALGSELSNEIGSLISHLKQWWKTTVFTTTSNNSLMPKIKMRRD